MKSDQPTWGLPLLVSLGIHLGIIVLLIMAAPTPSYRLKSVVENQPVVQAAVIDSAAIDAQVQAIQSREAQKEAAEQKRVQQWQAQVEAARQAKLAEEQRLTQIKAAQQKAQKLAATQAQLEQQRLEKLKAEQQQQAQVLADLKKQQKEAQAKALALKKQQEAQAAKALAEKKRQEAIVAKALAEQKKLELAEQQKALQQQLMQQQIANEQQQLVKAQQMQGILDQYRARILMAIGNQWLIPEGADPTISCLFTIDVTPAGIVSRVQLIRSSGNAVLDRAAETAIHKASPLPVPKDPSLFEHFRHFTLKMTPQDIAH